MVRKNTFVMLAVVAILLLQFADCMSAITHDQQSMQCCGSMPCDPSNQNHDCCKGMASAQIPNLYPVAHVTLDAPAMVVTEILGSSQGTLHPEPSHWDFGTPQHSPPD